MSLPGVLVLTQDEVQDTTDKISKMKVAELKDMCRALGERITGKKIDLYNRVALDFLNLRSSPDPAQQLAIRALVLKRCQGQDLPSFQDLYGAIRLGSFRVPAANTYAPELRPPGPPQTVHLDPIHPNMPKLPSGNPPPHRGHSLYFEESPFYRLVRLVHGTPQSCMPHHARGVCTINFTFLPEELRFFERTQSPNSNLKVYLLSGRQAGASLSSTKAQIEYPLPMEIKVNSVVVAQNFKGIKGKPGTAKPADITLLINGQDASNRIQIIYAQTTERYLIYVYFVERVACESMIEEILARPRIIKAATIRKVCAENEEEEDLVVSTSRVTLRDPLSYTRMKYPVQSLYCKHIQCFDGLIYLELQLQVPTWTCPICQEKIKVQDLAILEYFQDILDTVDQDTEQVQIAHDGSWLRIKEPELLKLPEAAVVNRPVKVNTPDPPVEVISLDSDLEEECQSHNRAPLPPPSVPPPSQHEKKAREFMPRLVKQGRHENPVLISSGASSHLLNQAQTLGPISGNNGDVATSVPLQVDAGMLHASSPASHANSSPTTRNSIPSSAPLPPPLAPPPSSLISRGLTANAELGSSSPLHLATAVDFGEASSSAQGTSPPLVNSRHTSQRNSTDSNALSRKSLKKSSLVDSASLAEHMHEVASLRGAQYARAHDHQKRVLNVTAPPGRPDTHVQEIRPVPSPYDVSSNSHGNLEGGVGNTAENTSTDSHTIPHLSPTPLLDSCDQIRRPHVLRQDYQLHSPKNDGTAITTGIHGTSNKVSINSARLPPVLHLPNLLSGAGVSSLAERVKTLANDHRGNSNSQDRTHERRQWEYLHRQYIPHGDNSTSVPLASGRNMAERPGTRHSHDKRPSQSLSMNENVTYLLDGQTWPQGSLDSQLRSTVPGQLAHHSLPAIPTQKSLRANDPHNPSQRSNAHTPKALSSTCVPIIPSHAHNVAGYRAYSDVGRLKENDVMSSSDQSHAGSFLLSNYTHQWPSVTTNPAGQTNASSVHSKVGSPQTYDRGQGMDPLMVRYRPNNRNEESHHVEPVPSRNKPTGEQSSAAERTLPIAALGNSLIPLPQNTSDIVDIDKVNTMKDQVITNLRILKRDTSSMTVRHQQQVEKMAQDHIQELHQLASTLDSEIARHVFEGNMGRLSDDLRRDVRNGTVSGARLRESYAKMIDANQRNTKQRLKLEHENERTLLQMAWFEQVEKFNRLYLQASEALSRQKKVDTAVEENTESRGVSPIVAQNRTEQSEAAVQKPGGASTLANTAKAGPDILATNEHSLPPVPGLRTTASNSSPAIENSRARSNACSTVDGESTRQLVVASGARDHEIPLSVATDGMLTPANESHLQSVEAGKSNLPANPADLNNERVYEHSSNTHQTVRLHSPRNAANTVKTNDAVVEKVINDRSVSREPEQGLCPEKDAINEAPQLFNDSSSGGGDVEGRVSYDSVELPCETAETSLPNQPSEIASKLHPLATQRQRDESPALFLDSDAPPSGSGAESPGTPIPNLKHNCFVEQLTSKENGLLTSINKGEKRPGDNQSGPPHKKAQPLSSIIGFALSEKALFWASRTSPQTSLVSTSTIQALRCQKPPAGERHSTLTHIPDPVVVDLDSEVEGEGN